MFFDYPLAPNSPVIPTSVGVAIASAYILHTLKTLKSLPKVTFYSTKINLYLRLITSALGTLAISISWSHASTGGGTLAITLPSLSIFLAGIWHYGVQFGMQHMSEGVLQFMKQAADIAKESPGVNSNGKA